MQGKFGFPIRSLIIWCVVLLVIVVIVSSLQNSPPRSAIPELAYSDLMDRAAKGQIASVQTRGDMILARGTDPGGEYVAYVPEGAMSDTLKELRDGGVSVSTARPRSGPTLGDILLSVLPMLLLIGAWFFFMRQIRRFKGSDGPSDPTRM